MASFSRTQKLQQASIAERIASLQVEQEAESKRFRQELRGKQEREWADFEERLNTERKELESKLEEERRRALEKKQREVGLWVEMDSQRQTKVRLLETQRRDEDSASSKVKDANLSKEIPRKRRKMVVESDESDLSWENEDEEMGQEEAPAQLPKFQNSQTPCLPCAEEKVECYPSKGKRATRCIRCASRRRKCVRQEQGSHQTAGVSSAKVGGNQTTSVPTAKGDRAQGAPLGTAGQDVVSALRETTASLKELVEELRRSSQPFLMKTELVESLVTGKVDAGGITGGMGP